MSSTDDSSGVVELETKHDYSPATKADVEAAITRRLVLFHEGLISRGQIKPIPLDPRDRVPVQS